MARRTRPGDPNPARARSAGDADDHHAPAGECAGRLAGGARRRNALGGAHALMIADPTPLSPDEATSHATSARRLVEALEGVVLGQPAAVRETVAALLA